MELSGKPVLLHLQRFSGVQLHLGGHFGADPEGTLVNDSAAALPMKKARFDGRPFGAEDVLLCFLEKLLPLSSSTPRTIQLL